MQEYHQALYNILTTAQLRLPRELYEGFFKDDILKLKELLDGLESLPAEVNNYRTENDILRLRAFIAEELRRNRELQLMFEEVVNIFRNRAMCPLDEYDYPSETCQGKECTMCWIDYLKSRVKGEMSFK